MYMKFEQFNMSKTSEEFVNWIHKKLIELETDPDVFGNYIIGILSEEETREEKSEALQDLLSEITDCDLQTLLTAILDKWEECHDTAAEAAIEKPPTIDVNKQLAELLEAQRIQAVVPERKYTEEERRLKEQILAQYAQTEISDEDDYDDGTGDGVEQKHASSSSVGIERNTNVQDVIQLQKEKREQARQESAAKKQKDKEDREKQRQLREEKKEKRKTVKGERRR